MRLHRLSLTAFGPFAKDEELDFDTLSAAGLFLLRGDTGAGKTSLLDAICFGLYGRLPGARNTAGVQRRLRSDHAAPDTAPLVEVEFSVRGRRLRVTRHPEWDRPKKRGTGTVRTQMASELAEWDGSTWVPLSHRNDEVGQQIGTLLGMDLEQFTRVAMLPQGEFAAFLRSKDSDREKLLKRLFDTGVYDTTVALAAERKRELMAEVGDGQTRRDAALTELVSTLGAAWGEDTVATVLEGAAPGEPAWFEGLAAEASAREESAGRAASAASEAAERAREARAAAQQSRQDAQAWAEASRRRAALDEGSEAAARDTEQWALHQRALTVRSELDAAEQARRGAETAADTEQEALRALADVQARTVEAEGEDAAAWERDVAALPGLVGGGSARDSAGGSVGGGAVEGGVESDGADRREACGPASGDPTAVAELLSGWRERADRAVEAAAQALRAEEAATSAATAAARAATESDRAEAALQTATQERDAAEAAAQQASAAAAEHPAPERSAEQAEAELEQARTKVAAARTAEAALAAQTTARDAEASARDALRAAQDAATGLRERRLEQLKQVLAAEELHAGAPCPLCGSVEHPHPVQVDREALEEISTQAVKRADAEVERAAQALEAATATARAADAKGDAAAIAAGGLSVEAATQAMDAAAARVKDTQERWDAHRKAQQREQDAAKTLAAATAALTERTTAAAAAKERAEQAKESAEQAAKLAADGAAGHPDVATRRAAVAAWAGALERAARSHTTASGARDEAAAASRRAAEALTAAGLSAEGARDGVLPEPEALALRQRIEAVAAETARVAELEASEAVARARAARQAGEAVPDDEAVAALQAAVATAEEAASTAAGQSAVAAAHRTSLQRARSRVEAIDAELGPLLTRARTATAVADLVAGNGENLRKMPLPTYVLAARLETVAEAATQRLAAMSDGRYRLLHVDSTRGNNHSGLGLAVEDAWTGAQRAPETLSGGETFLASLALALGLADVVQEEAGGVDIETLFVDEGFGTLDADTLDLVLDGLDGLRRGGRLVGVVSHVSELAGRIPVQIRVDKTRHGSTARVVGAPADPAPVREQDPAA